MYLYSSFFGNDLESKVKAGVLNDKGGVKLFKNPIDAYDMRVSQSNIPDNLYKSGIAVIEIDTDTIGIEIEDCDERIDNVQGVTHSKLDPKMCRVITYYGGRGSKLDNIHSIRSFR